MCVCVCVCVCVSVLACVHHQDGHEVDGKDSNFGKFTPKWRICCWWVELSHQGHTWSQQCSSPLAPGAALSRVRPQYQYHRSPAIFFTPLDLQLSMPPYHRTPWGLLCWQSDRTTITATSGFSCRSTLALDGHFHSHSSQLPLALGLSRVGLASPSLCYSRGPQKQDPGSLDPDLRPLWARRTEEERSVCVRGVCVRA